tara:strand:+ start:1463 stop:2701 length:1239 start_codon:yes stop_codon:yes gene_type:complete
MKFINFIAEKVGSSKVTLSFLFILIFTSLFILVPLLPYQLGQNLLDLKFGFDQNDIKNSFTILGEKGKNLHIFVSLTLDIIFPVIYVTFHLGIYKFSNYENKFIYILPLVAGFFDILENIQCAAIMTQPSIETLSNQQIIFASSTNQIKWILVLFMVMFAVFPILRKIIKKLRKSFLRRYLFITRKEKFNYKLNDVLIELDIRDSIDREIYFNGYYEEKQLAYLREIISKFNIKTFIDVGSNIGIYSLRVGKIFPEMKIYAFEPHPSAFQRLQTNISLNKLSHAIEAHNLALSDENKEGYLNSAKRFGKNQSGGARVDLKGEIKIQLARADDIIKIKNDVIAIKIDVEGFENQVLRGSQELIESNKIFLQIEIFDENYDEISKFLLSKKFKLLNHGNFTHQKDVKDYFYINF